MGKKVKEKTKKKSYKRPALKLIKTEDINLEGPVALMASLKGLSQVGSGVCLF